MALFGLGKKQASKEAKILKFGLAAWPANLDPRDAQDHTTHLALSQMFEKPVRISQASSEPEPDLLAELPRLVVNSEGQETWVARVRDDVLFSDGVPLTASHIASCLASCDIGTQFEVLSSDHEITFIPKQPNPLFVSILAAPYCGIFRREGNQFIGTGPFKLSEPLSPEFIRLERNEHYRNEVPLDGIDFVNVPPDPDGHPTELIRRIADGEIHITNGISRSDVSKLPGVPRSFTPGTSTAILHLNSRRLKDPHLRKAIALALDRRALASLSYENSLAFTATGILPPAFPPIPDRLRHSVAEAKEELELCVDPVPKTIKLLEVYSSRPYLPHPTRTSQGISEQLAKIGIKVETMQSEDFTDFYDKCRDGNCDLIAAGWIADTTNPADFIEANLGSEFVPEHGTRPGYRFNHGGYQNKLMDEAIADYRVGDTAQARYAIAQMIAEDTPLVALLYGPSVVVHLPNVKGFQHGLTGDYILSEVDLE